MAGKTPLYLIKVGGSIITDVKRQDTPNLKNIRRLATELKEALSEGKFRAIVGHGSGSFGHFSANRYKTHMGLINKRSNIGAAITQDKAAELNRIIVKEFIRKGLNAISYPPSAGCVAEGGKIKEWNTKPIEMSLENGFLPIVYGDVVVDRKQGVSIAPTEELIRYLAAKMATKRVIVAGDTDGIFDIDPKIDHSARLIGVINKKNIKSALVSATGSKKIDVTGGMHTKLEYLYNVSRSSGATCEIINGNVKGRLYSALSGSRTIRTLIDGR